MKRLATILTMLGLTCSAQFNFTDLAWNSPSSSLVYSCAGSTSKQSDLGVVTSYALLGADVATYYSCSFFTAAATWNACSVTVTLYKIGSPTGNLTASYWTDNAGIPGTLVGSWSAPVSATTLGTGSSTITFTGLAANLSSGTGYWLVLHDDTAIDINNDVYIDVVSGSDTIYTSEDMTPASFVFGGLGHFNAEHFGVAP